MSSDPTNGGAGHSLRAHSTWANRTELQDVEEFPLLLSSGDVRALIDVARQQGVSAVGLARQLVTDYLQRTRGAVRATTNSPGRTYP
jgi:hypothetical protein